MSYTIKNLSEIKDSAPEFGMDSAMEARFGKKDVEAEQTGFAHIKVKPNMRQPFAHFHVDAEELYFVLSGAGQIKVDDDIVALAEHDVIRLAPGSTHQLQAGDDGLEILAVGPHHENDGDLIKEGFWE